MSIYRDQNAGNLRKWMDKVDRFMKQSKLANSAVGRDGIEVYDGGWIRILNGGLQVIGTATISGTLDVTGTFNASGSNTLSGENHLTGPTDVTRDLSIEGVTTISGNTSITGELNVTGPTKLDGITDIGGDTTITGLLDVQGNMTISGQLDVTGAMATKGTLSVEGVTTLSADLNVDSNGKINVGNLQIEPANGGQINFLNGALSSMPTFGMMLNHTSNIDLKAPVLNLNAGTIHTSLPSKPEAELTPIGVDLAGNIYRIGQEATT